MKRNGRTLMNVLIILMAGMPGVATLCQGQEPVWVENRSMPDVRWGHSSCELNGKVYVLGGRNAFNFPTIPLNIMWMYDPLLDTWITRKNMEIVRTGFSTCVYNGKIHAIGGAQKVYGTPTLTTKSIEVYDPEQDSWTQLTDMPVSRYDHTASIVGSKIYIIGGYDDPFAQPFSRVDIYDLATETWTTGTPMLTPRVQLSTVVLNGKIYAIGGQRGVSTNESGEKTMEVYDPATDTWTSAADMLTQVKMMSACTLNGRIYVFGGAEGYCTPALSGVQEYKPETDSWINIGDMPRELCLQTSTVVDNKIYISGGLEGDCSIFNIRSTMYEFDPHPNPWVEIPDTAFLYALIEEGVDTNGDSLISYAEAEAKTTLQVSGRGISDMTGIEAFINLDSLLCGNNSLTNLEVSNCEVLSYLDCRANQITNLNIAGCKILKYLRCGSDYFYSGNHLASLDVSNNTILEGLYCAGNQLTNLDITNLVSLKKLRCADNQLSNLNTSNNPEMDWLSSGNNLLTSLDLSSNHLLEQLYLSDNLLTTLDISSNTALEVLDIQNMNTLYDVCVWTVPFPPLGVDVFTTGSPNVYFTTECATSIEETDLSAFKIYPNPANTLLTIETEYPDHYSIGITSLNGQLIFSTNMQGTTHQIDLSSFQKGVYLITIRSKDFVTTGKIIKL